VVGRGLGRVGMGAVYEAFDAEREQRVALKTLTRLRPEHLFSLKNEFRALSDISHANLVCLHGLYCDADFWFLTMDYVDGMTLREALAAGRDSADHLPRRCSSSAPFVRITTMDRVFRLCSSREPRCFLSAVSRATRLPRSRTASLSLP
jgi:hypothetical protein